MRQTVGPAALLCPSCYRFQPSAGKYNQMRFRVLFVAEPNFDVEPVFWRGTFSMRPSASVSPHHRKSFKPTHSIWGIPILEFRPSQSRTVSNIWPISTSVTVTTGWDGLMRRRPWARMTVGVRQVDRLR